MEKSEGNSGKKGKKLQLIVNKDADEQEESVADVSEKDAGAQKLVVQKQKPKIGKREMSSLELPQRHSLQPVVSKL